MKTTWIFIAYKDEEKYPMKPFHTKIFSDFDEMKTHSANHSKKHKHILCYPKYVSTYVKTNQL